MEKKESVTFTKICPLCRQPSEITVDAIKFAKWQTGSHIQDVWPEKTPDEREMMITGSHPECWDKTFPEDS